VSLESLVEATNVAADRLCRACFDGEYPIAVPESEKGKHLLEPLAAAAQAGLPGD
jgi:amidophosphoribosyltransferase